MSIKLDSQEAELKFFFMSVPTPPLINSSFIEVFFTLVTEVRL